MFFILIEKLKVDNECIYKIGVLLKKEFKRECFKIFYID